ncbi:calcium-binding protein [Sagittula sp. SSi028]|uniref:calcium-binding protein n=1 Tax=Sagittula sp. SSi028 TaxID=3400636 RepID=UPI003AF44DC8
MPIFEFSGTGPHGGSDQNDTITSIAEGDGQIHLWGNGGDDEITLDFTVYGSDTYNPSYPRQWWYGGHHIYGDGASGGGGSDDFNFTNLSNIQGITVGRFEDLDLSRDTIRIEGIKIDLYHGAGSAGGYQWKVVNWDTDPNDAATGTQQWLVINTNGGILFYALEGARIITSGAGGSNNDNQERHFIHFSNLPTDLNGQPSESSVWDLPATSYIDPVNYIPIEDDDGIPYVADNGGLYLNDYDQVRSDLSAGINGTGYGDVIAAGINDDTVTAQSGDDTVWGGSGNDSIDGGSGADLLYGNLGQDILLGGAGADTLSGGQENDTLTGGTGADLFVFSGSGVDVITDFDASEGDQLEYNGTIVDPETTSYSTAMNNGDLWITFNEAVRVALQHYNAPASPAAPADINVNVIDATTVTGRIDGTSGNDSIIGGNGNQDLRGNAGNDTLIDGEGSDVLRGGTGADVFVLVADGNQDRINGFEFGEDLIDISAWGVTSADQLTMEVAYNHGEWHGRSYIYYRDETIRLDGFNQVELDQLSDADFVFGSGAASDPGSNTAPPSQINVIDATNVTGRIDGTSGDDSMVGGDGSQDLRGSAGNDTLIDGEGPDVLRGGTGADVFVLVADGNQDRITDFEIGEDLIDLTDWGLSSIDQLTMEVGYNHGEWHGRSYIYYEDEIIRMDGLNQIELNQLSDADFIF